MKSKVRPPWWTEENEERANAGERIVLSAEFSYKYSQQLSDLSLEVCKAFRIYLHGDTEEERQQAYKDALQRLKDYKRFCYKKKHGKIHYEELTRRNSSIKDAHKHSFAFAFYSLYKNI